MGFVFIDSFSGYATPQLGLKWNGGGLGSGATITTGGRHGNLALSMGNDSQITSVLKNPTHGLLCGFAVQTPKAPTAQNGSFFLLDTTDANIASVGFSVGAGGVSATAGNLSGSHTTVNSANGLWFQNVYFHIQIKVVIVYSGGNQNITVNVKFNNVLVATATQSITAADKPIVDFRFIVGLGQTAAQNYIISDFYAIDLQDGIAPTDFVSPTGDLDVSPLFPDAPGIITQWAPFPGAPNWSKVNEVPPDGDTTYVKDSNVGDIDLYHFPGDITIAPAGSIPYAAQVNCFAEKDDPAGSRSFVPTIHIASSGLNYQNAADVAALGNNYAYYYSMYPFNYATNAPWNLGEIGGSGSQFGQKVIA